ncbi:T-cell surface glycoprotein CD5 isoform X2 [Cygnus olor]|uniref:T-cell surface glycoprotein CD5 isoform X2 n=1 Tax=Cygnus olor TaxID=8869 RepID=UPI001ADE650C|nr:T-cell surface glycoprotein CD5 isoform X2 [Cygnus olor]
MAAWLPAVRLLLVLGTWAICSHRGAALNPTDPPMRLTGGSCRCTGKLEVNMKGVWSPVCQGIGSQAMVSICQRLGCGPPTAASPFVVDRNKEPWVQALRCTGKDSCQWQSANCSSHATFACSEPATTTTKPPPMPPTTSPEPTGPPRLRLVDSNFSCSGFVELHMRGRWGAVASSPGNWMVLAARICSALGCGSPIDGPAAPQTSQLLVKWEAVEPCRSPELLDCFNRTRDGRGRAPAFLTCSGSQPQAVRRLAGGPTPCEGDIEVFQQGRWQVLCNRPAQRNEWGRQLCRELRCGNLSSSTEVREPPSMGVLCDVRHLHLCPDSPKLLRSCFRTRVVCQDSKPRPAGIAAGTVASICLALLLFGILLLICGPPAYRWLMKKISKKKQRQWIGPTGLNQNVSFHRNSTVTLRPRADGQRAQGGDNDYAQPPQKSSYLSAYTALEGAARSSNPPDNSSDSDYDLQSARRL